ncbi:MAG: ferrous iron transport protein B [Clostridiales bacterium]|nr:ferrous iron transport protein B [Clostridiales bacterium]
MVFALAGNQNCGKTTLFNQLTGSNQHVGNFPGVTVEQKSGIIKGHDEATVVDLPGIYSLSPYTNEEIVTRDFLVDEKPDGIINIVDATNIERNFYLTMQLLELKIPMVVALNMMDEMRTNGATVDIDKLSEELGVTVIPISASKNEGIAELIQAAIDTVKTSTLPGKVDFCSGAVHRAIHAVSHLIEDHAERLGVPSRFAATKLLEGDEPMQKRLGLSKNECETIEHSVEEMENDVGLDREAALADMRYTFIEGLCSRTVVKGAQSKEHLRSIKIDNILTHKYLGIPIFLGIMALVFWVTFGAVGSFLSDLLSSGIDALTDIVSTALTNYGINPVVHSLVVDGIFAGVGSVLSFMPMIVVLFFFLSILEDTGYMARVAFVMDKLLRKIGLSGKSFVPMLIGFGCSVPAIMSSRTLSSNRDRKMTILLTPFMSCSAKVPIYAMFAAAFFPKRQALVMMGLYLFGILTAIICGLIFKGTLFRGKPIPFVMELPNYRLPTLKSVLLLMWEKAKDFIVKAFTIIFAATVIIWFLRTFDLKLNVVSDASNSILALIGSLIAPIFKPLGFGDWRISTALITGFTAKEAVISTLAVLTGTSLSTLSETLGAYFTSITAISFLVFTLLYTPCVAAVAAVKRELGSRIQSIGVMIFQTALAWICAFAVYNIIKLF